MSTVIDRADRTVLRANLRNAIKDACRSRGDSREHLEACLRECLEEDPPAAWPWWLEYWRGQYRCIRGRVS